MCHDLLNKAAALDPKVTPSANIVKLKEGLEVDSKTFEPRYWLILTAVALTLPWRCPAGLPASSGNPKAKHAVHLGSGPWGS